MCQGNKGKTGVIVAAYMYFSKISARYWRPGGRGRWWKMWVRAGGCNCVITLIAPTCHTCSFPLLWSIIFLLSPELPHLD